MSDWLGTRLWRSFVPGVLLFSGFIPLPGLLAQSTSVHDSGIPHLERRGKATQLIVDGRPMLILGGELKFFQCRVHERRLATVGLHASQHGASPDRVGDD
jgi:hypothetical protein